MHTRLFLKCFKLKVKKSIVLKGFYYDIEKRLKIFSVTRSGGFSTQSRITIQLKVLKKKTFRGKVCAASPTLGPWTRLRKCACASSRVNGFVSFHFTDLNSG